MTIPATLRDHAINCGFLGDVECAIARAFSYSIDYYFDSASFTTQWRVYCLLIAEALS